MSNSFQRRVEADASDINKCNKKRKFDEYESSNQSPHSREGSVEKKRRK